MEKCIVTIKYWPLSETNPSRSKKPIVISIPWVGREATITTSGVIAGLMAEAYLALMASGHVYCKGGESQAIEDFITQIQMVCGERYDEAKLIENQQTY